MDDSRIRSKTAPFSFENGLVWTVPKTALKTFFLEKLIADIVYYFNIYLKCLISCLTVLYFLHVKGGEKSYYCISHKQSQACIYSTEASLESEKTSQKIKLRGINSNAQSVLFYGSPVMNNSGDDHGMDQSSFHERHRIILHMIVLSVLLDLTEKFRKRRLQKECVPVKKGRSDATYVEHNVYVYHTRSIARNNCFS